MSVCVPYRKPSFWDRSTSNFASLKLWARRRTKARLLWPPLPTGETLNHFWAWCSRLGMKEISIRKVSVAKAVGHGNHGVAGKVRFDLVGHPVSVSEDKGDTRYSLLMKNQGGDTSCYKSRVTHLVQPGCYRMMLSIQEIRVVATSTLIPWWPSSSWGGKQDSVSEEL